MPATRRGKLRNNIVESYLQRIGYHESLRPTLAVLRKLHRRHLLVVPFENLDIHLGRPIALADASFCKKIVEDGRGGFCYELNGSFANLLRALGFKVSLLSAKVARKNGRFSPDFDHMALLVKLRQSWLVDVGFGESFTLPKLLNTPSSQRDNGAKYKIIQDKGRRILSRWNEKENSWKPQYSFTLRRRKLADYASRCHWQQSSPESHFRQGRLITRLTPTGRITLTDTKFIITKRGRKIERPVGTQGKFDELLQERFGIMLD